MKKIITLGLCVFVFFSCKQMYNFCQVFSLNPSTESENLSSKGNATIYEDDNCIVVYSFWAETGDPGFLFYNKSEKIIYVDLSKSFFMTNDEAKDYYNSEHWGATSTQSVMTTNSSSSSVVKGVSVSANLGYTYLGKAGLGIGTISGSSPILTNNSYSATSSIYTTLGNTFSYSSMASSTNSITQDEKSILAIPPKAYKIVRKFNILSTTYGNCDFDRFPKTKASISFTEEESPFHFTNYITYNFGEGSDDIKIRNTFYISQVTNYAEPEIITYELRDKTCKNMSNDPDAYKNGQTDPDVYDKYFDIDINNKFYVTYYVESKTRLYPYSEQYYYNTYYDGYVKNSSGWIGSSNTSVNERTVGAAGFHTY